MPIRPATWPRPQPARPVIRTDPVHIESDQPSRGRLGSWIVACFGALALIAASGLASAQPRHAIAMHGEPALPAGFSHFPYVNPSAPKGGRLVHGVVGTFDSLNPFIVKGLASPYLRGYVFESLM